MLKPFFSKTSNRFVKTGFFYPLPDYVMSHHVSNLWFDSRDHPTVGPIVSGIIGIATHLLSVNQWIACLLHPGHSPQTRCTDAAKQRTVAYLSDRGQRGHWEDVQYAALETG